MNLPAKIKLLAVDDEEGVLEVVRMYFSPRGYEVLTASDGTEAIEICKTEKPRVILLDLKMKKMDGDQALPHLKQLVPDAVVIVASAYTEEVLDQKIASLGVHARIEKPVSIIELEKVVCVA